MKTKKWYQRSGTLYISGETLIDYLNKLHLEGIKSEDIKIITTNSRVIIAYYHTEKVPVN